MKLKNILIRTTVIVAVVSTFLSCDDDFNTVGSEVIGDVNFEDNQYTAIPVAFSRKFDRVQTNNLIASVDQNGRTTPHANVLGIYNDPVYGKSEYSILSQVLPPIGQNGQLTIPSFGTNAVLDSVVFSLPYSSTAIGTTSVSVAENVTEMATTYRLDSIYGSSPFKLSIYKSDYFLRGFDPTSNNRQVYYSDDIETNFGPEVEGTLLHTNNAFVPSAEEILLIEKTTDAEGTVTTNRERVSPRLRVNFSADLDEDKEVVALFKTLFLDKEGSVELSNVNNFLNYFRGIYIKAEPVNNTGNLLYLNTAGAQLTLHYSFDTSNTDNEGNPIRDQGELALGFSNTIMNSIKTDFEPTIANELLPENQDSTNGEADLYLKGGAGSYAVIDLFGGNVINENGEEENELSFLKRQDWLINDASIKFYINQDKVISGAAEPERIYIFNLETGAPLLDYSSDPVNSNEFPIVSRINHLGRISRDSDGNGEFYRIRITQYILNVLNDQFDNVKLGLSVSQNVNIITSSIGDTPITNNEVIPTSSIVSHEGTVLYGNGASVPESKRLKLDIFYTASKNN
ncbi:DUF4270 domain-containing protein [Aquimarina algiphila]|uniref:DUF4270 domain-containing protein n=1 Tax=Aquimarina algiphila TaxID=2047982 RepID=UPI00232C5981|nr:DUF4270 domain-containing protein [Aquimarina algiphila]